MQNFSAVFTLVIVPVDDQAFLGSVNPIIILVLLDVEILCALQLSTHHRPHFLNEVIVHQCHVEEVL